ncbi:MAG: hypothetical protein ACRD6W_00875 [Nitrososphaerales archaeon]
MSSSVPTSVPYFVTLATTALGADATVSFGKPLPLYSAPITLQVTGVVGDAEPAELGPNYRREETYSIQCELTAYAGDQNFLDRLSECMTAYALLTVAVANDPTLGGSVRFAECGQYQFVPDADAQGQSIGNLTFDVRCSARITSLT